MVHLGGCAEILGIADDVIEVQDAAPDARVDDGADAPDDAGAVEDDANDGDAWGSAADADANADAADAHD